MSAGAKLPPSPLRDKPKLSAGPRERALALSRANDVAVWRGGRSPAARRGTGSGSSAFRGGAWP